MPNTEVNDKSRTNELSREKNPMNRNDSRTPAEELFWDAIRSSSKDVLLAAGKGALVSKEDLSKLIQKNDKLGKNESQVAAALYINFDSITEGHAAAITTGDLDRLKALKPEGKFQRDMSKVARVQENTTAHKLFADEQNPLKSIKLESVQQGLSGDCAFKAGLSGLANSRPEEILKMVSKLGNSFQVKLPGSNDISILNRPSDEQLGLFNPNQDSGFWPLLLSEAYGEDVYRASDAIARHLMDSETPDEWAGENGDQTRAIEKLTGHPVHSKHLANLDEDGLKTLLVTGQKHHSVMVLNTAPGEQKTPDGFNPEHAFTITNVNVSQGQLELTIRDPQGKGVGRPDGTQTINYAALKRNFNAVFVEANE